MNVKILVFLIAIMTIVSSSLFAVIKYGSYMDEQGYKRRTAEYEADVKLLENRLEVERTNNENLALELKEREVLLSQSMKRTPMEVIKYVTKTQGSTDCNPSHGAVWLFDAKSQDCNCSDVDSCSGLSAEEAGASSEIGSSVYMQQATLNGEYCAYAIRRHNALVDVVLRLKQQQRSKPLVGLVAN